MATIRDVAKESGVSVGAVSRILNNDSTLSVSPETRKKVFDAAKKLDYTKPLRAKSTKSAFTMGLVQWFTSKEETNDKYYVRARQGVEDFCVKHAINVIRVFPNDIDLNSKLKNVDGLICLGKFSEKEVKTFISICKNIVFLDMPVEKYGISSLTMDFSQAVYSALHYLTKLGHSKIAYLGGKEYVGDNEPLKDERTFAYKKYMSHRNLDSTTFFKEGEFSSQSGYEMMNELLDAPTLPSAVFAANDAIAIGAMKAIEERKLKIPEDISIIGFNNEDICSFVNPPLTSINAPAYDMGQHGANIIFSSNNLDVKTVLRVRIPCKLIIRDSCANKACD